MTTANENEPGTIQKSLRRSARYTSCYVAAIRGTSTQYGLSREFVGEYRREYDYVTWMLTPGMYEFCDMGCKRIALVVPSHDTLKIVTPSAARVAEILRRLDAGESYDAARVATKGL